MFAPMLQPLTLPLHDPILVEILPGRLVRVLQPIRWRGPYPDTVPTDLISDGGSKPSLTWPFLGHPLSSRVLICYLLHDLDLSRGMAWGEALHRFNVRLRAVGCPTPRRWLEVAGVWARGLVRRMTR
jgi:hypothetical protein